MKTQLRRICRAVVFTLICLFHLSATADVMDYRVHPGDVSVGSMKFQVTAKAIGASVDFTVVARPQHGGAFPEGSVDGWLRISHEGDFIATAKVADRADDASYVEFRFRVARVHIEECEFHVTQGFGNMPGGDVYEIVLLEFVK